jgi:hypothetical protein
MQSAATVGSGFAGLVPHLSKVGQIWGGFSWRDLADAIRCHGWFRLRRIGPSLVKGWTDLGRIFLRGVADAIRRHGWFRLRRIGPSLVKGWTDLGRIFLEGLGGCNPLPRLVPAPPDWSLTCQKLDRFGADFLGGTWRMQSAATVGSGSAGLVPHLSKVGQIWGGFFWRGVADAIRRHCGFRLRRVGEWDGPGWLPVRVGSLIVRFSAQTGSG